MITLTKYEICEGAIFLSSSKSNLTANKAITDFLRYSVKRPSLSCICCNTVKESIDLLNTFISNFDKYYTMAVNLGLNQGYLEYMKREATLGLVTLGKKTSEMTGYDQVHPFSLG